MLARRLLVVVATAAVPLLVVACANRAPKPLPNVNVTVAETGTLIDVTDRNGTVVFALPGDAQARRIAVVFTGGMLILFIVTSLFFVPVLFTDAPRLPSLFNFSR